MKSQTWEEEEEEEEEEYLFAKLIHISNYNNIYWRWAARKANAHIH